MSFDEQPEDPHGECRLEIKRLQGLLAELEAELKAAEDSRDEWKAAAEIWEDLQGRTRTNRP